MTGYPPAGKITDDLASRSTGNAQDGAHFSPANRGAVPARAGVWARALGRFFRLFRPSPSRAQSSPSPLPELAPVPEWREEDAAELRRFMASDAGTRLAAMLRQLTTRTALAAIHAESERLHWQCGKAAGVQSVAEAIDALGRWQPKPEEPGRDVPTDDLEWLHERKP